MKIPRLLLFSGSAFAEITHRDARLNLYSTEDAGAERRSAELNYTTAQTACEARSIAVSFDEATGLRSQDRWTLSADRATITMDRTASHSLGEQQKLILEKQQMSPAE